MRKPASSPILRPLCPGRPEKRANFIVEALDVPAAVLLQHVHISLEEDAKAKLENLSSRCALPLRPRHQPGPLHLLLPQVLLVLERLVDRPPLRNLGEDHHQRPGVVEPARLPRLVIRVPVHVGRDRARPVEKVRPAEIGLCGVAAEHKTLGAQARVRELEVHVEGADLGRDGAAEGAPVGARGLRNRDERVAEVGGLAGGAVDDGGPGPVAEDALDSQGVDLLVPVPARGDSLLNVSEVGDQGLGRRCRPLEQADGDQSATLKPSAHGPPAGAFWR